MRYVILVSHGTFAQGLHSVLNMLAGKRDDVLSISLIDGMGGDRFDENVDELLNNIKKEDEIILLADIIGGSPLTTTINVLSRKGLLENTVAFGGMNLPLALNAVLMKDSMEILEIKDLIISEARESIKEFELVITDNDDEDI